MRINGITINDDVVDIELVENYIISHKLMTIDNLCDWNREAVRYLETQKEKTTTDFLQLFKRSRTTKKLDIPYDTLHKQASKTKGDWKRILEELTKIPYGNEGESETNNEKETD